MNLAVFASGTGTNFEAIVKATQNQQLKANVVLCVCDHPEALVIEKANALKIPVFSFKASDYPNKASYEQLILNACQLHQVSFIALAGYMRIIGPTLLQQYPHRIVNIHPSLLPKYKGKDALKQALAAGDLTLGATVHYVNDELDGGKIILQQSFRRSPNDCLETIEHKLHQIEHQLYIKALQQCLKEVI